MSSAWRICEREAAFENSFVIDEGISTGTGERSYEPERRHRSADRRGGWSPEAERRRLAGELHDAALQSLLAARQDLQAVANGDHQALAWATRALDEAVRQIRRIVGYDVEPRSYTGTLVDALHQCALDAARYGNFLVHLDLPAKEPLAHQDLIFRLARELLTNAAKHSSARNVHLRLLAGERVLVLEMEDDGVGFDPDVVPAGAHIGLKLVRERVNHVGGTLRITPADPTGTCVHITLPC